MDTIVLKKGDVLRGELQHKAFNIVTDIGKRNRLNHGVPRLRVEGDGQPFLGGALDMKGFFFSY